MTIQFSIIPIEQFLDEVLEQQPDASLLLNETSLGCFMRYQLQTKRHAELNYYVKSWIEITCLTLPDDIK